MVGSIPCDNRETRFKSPEKSPSATEHSIEREREGESRFSRVNAFSAESPRNYHHHFQPGASVPGAQISRRHNFSTVTTPYLLLGSDVVGDSPCGGKLVNFNLYDPKTQNQAKTENQTLPKELSESKWIGSSRGWLASMNKNDSTVHLSKIFNPSKKKETISLPPLTRDKFEHLVNVSVSSPNDEEECVVAVKFYGSRVSLCRLGDSEWTRVHLPCPSFHSSTVIYSERVGRFYLNNCNP
ncbi:hypothetical protein Bca101_056486 [Brassica carinata]